MKSKQKIKTNNQSLKLNGKAFLARLKLFGLKFGTAIGDLVYPARLSCLICDDDINDTPGMICESCYNKLPVIVRPCKLCGVEISNKNYGELMAEIETLIENYEGDLTELKTNDRYKEIKNEFLNEKELCDRCKNKKPKFDAGVSPFSYGDEITNLIFQLKYHNKKFLAEFMAEHIINALKDYLKTERKQNYLLEVDLNKEQTFYVLPAPIRAANLKKRGYNQAALIAKVICEKFNDEKLTLIYDNKILKRIKQTVNQHGLTSSERIDNLKDAFKTEAQVKGKNFIIVDDVITTGATMEELAKTLKEKNANFVMALSFAHTKKKGI
jgi:ComF family protein